MNEIRSVAPSVPDWIRLRGGLVASGKDNRIQAWPRCETCGTMIRVTNGVAHCPKCEKSP